MGNSFDSKFLDDPEFQSLLVGCLESLQRGETIDRDALAKNSPKFSDEIGRFLDDRQLLEEAASDFGDVPPSRVAISAYANTMDSNSGSSDFSIGEAIRYIGEYEVLEEIARGGMGVVFKARQQKLNRIVALKMILAGRLADSSDVERFYREARAAGKLQHSNIVPVHEIGEHDGRHYFTMDFVDGPSLAETLREETLAPDAAARLVRDTAVAVQYAHEQGTVHRDLKPANVLLNENGQPMVTDFGLAKMLSGVDDETRAELTAAGQILGTPSYMSPEQAAGKMDLVGQASDIYSLGAILYACLTGRAPFVADSPVDTLLQVMNKEPVSPRELNPSVPKDLETICLKCLTKEPHKRYSTAQELADDLERFIDGRPVSARPIGTISRTIRWCRRNPMVASLLTLVFVSMFAGTTISALYANLANRHAESEGEQRHLAEQQRDAADQARKLALAAKESSQDLLATSLYGESRALRLAGQPGWRWESLSRLKQAEEIRGRDRSTPATKDIVSRGDLRSEAVASLISSSARESRRWPCLTSAISPDGRFAALLGVSSVGRTRKPEFRIVDLASGEETLMPESTVVTSGNLPPAIALGSGGETVLTTDVSAGEITFWDVSTAQRQRQLSWPESVASSNKGRRGVTMASHFLSGDGRYLAAWRWKGSTTEFVVWDIMQQAAAPVDVETNSIFLVANPFNGDGSRVAFASGSDQVTIWDTQQKQVHDRINLDGGAKVTGPPRFSPDGKSVVFACRTRQGDSSIQFWDVGEGTRQFVISTGKIPVTQTSISPDGQRLAAGTLRGGILIYRLDDRQEELRLDGDGGLLRSLEWGRNGRTLYSGSAAEFKKWEIAVTSPVNTRGLDLGGSAMPVIQKLAFSPDGRWLAVAGLEKAFAYQWPTCERMHAFDMRGVQKFAFSPDGKRLALLSGLGVSVRDLSTGEEQAAFLQPVKGKTLNMNELFYHVWFQSPESLVVVRGNEVLIGSLGNGQKEINWSPYWGIGSGRVAVGGLGRFLAHGSIRDKNTAVVDLESKSSVVDLPEGVAVEFAPTGRWFATLQGNSRSPDSWKIGVWDLVAGKHQFDIRKGRPLSVGFGPHDRYLAVRFFDGTAQYWDLTDQKPLFRWRLDEEQQANLMIGQIKFTPDGAFLVAPITSESRLEVFDIESCRSQLSNFGLDW